ncbi:MAG: tetratricopeptide repeat protein [Deltaproteobacteria bacterium]|nr:tetratricopeptide repeat protein [Deltaproteobacteria bacterium]
MGFLKIFSGKEPEEYEKKGDSLFSEKKYGLAKIEYETALEKYKKRYPDTTDIKNTIQSKITKSKELLALQHKKTAEELVNSQLFDDAEEILALALELTSNPKLKIELEERLKEIHRHSNPEKINDPYDLNSQFEETEKEFYQEEEEEYFSALCNSLPEEMQNAYQGYGEPFKAGYIALNKGDFELAEAKLHQAMEDNQLSGSFINLELATACLNLQKHEEARVLLEDFIKKRPDLPHGYQLLCELFLERGEYDHAQEVLLSCPEKLFNSLPIQLLRGEMLFQAGRYQEAESLYLEYLKSSGWDEGIARSLAKTYEALLEKEKAMDMYSEIMSQSKRCGNRIDTFIKRKFADLSFESKMVSKDILELYLSLVQEDPDNKDYYFERISQIYSAQGNEKESQRYKALSFKKE